MIGLMLHAVLNLLQSMLFLCCFALINEHVYVLTAHRLAPGGSEVAVKYLKDSVVETGELCCLSV